ncbi:MAG: alkaline phosphatase family protein [Treponema sp.]|nr:alkaline phosphatase family protein [Candidatus Treponema caballi]
MDKPVFPDYTNSIVNFSCSILKHFGVPVRHNTLPAADAVLEGNYKHVVVLLLDGLGVNILEKHLSPDAFLRRHFLTGYSSVFPPTTTASTTSMLSGLTPIEHGWLGWDVYFEQIDKIVTCFFNTLQGTTTPAADFDVARTFLPYDSIHTLINNAREPGDGSVVPVADLVFPFGPKPFPGIDDWFAEIKRQTTLDTRTFTYAYWENPDHGHTDETRVNLEEDYPEIWKMLVRPPSLEHRGISFYVKDEYKTLFASEFERLFGSDYVLFTREEALEKELFGPGEPNANLTGIGDYIAAAVGEKTLYPSRTLCMRTFKSQHAGMTEAEMKIPLIVWKS